MDSLRLIIRELIEVESNVTFILVCPSSEQICTMILGGDTTSNCSQDPQHVAGSNYSVTPSINFDSQIFSSQLTSSSSQTYFYLPVHIFEALHLYSYNEDFLKTYVRISLKLEIESIAATQYRREAFSKDEVIAGEKILAVVNAYQKRLEEMWRDSRWIVEWINYAREKPTSIQHQHCSLFFIKTSDLRRFIEQLTSKTIQFTFKCETCRNVINSVSLNYGDGNWKRNLNQQISQLSRASTCQCAKTSSMGYTLNHVDSVLGEDNDYLLNSNDLSRINSVHEFIDTDSAKTSIANLRATSDLKLNEKNPTTNSEKKSTLSEKDNLITLVSKMFISQPSKASSSITSNCIILNSYMTENPVRSNHDLLHPNYHVDCAYSSTNSTSSGYSSIASARETAHTSFEYYRKFMIVVDLATGLKIDFNFECIVNREAMGRDIIVSAIEKLNSFVSSYNEKNSNASEETRKMSYEDTSVTGGVRSSSGLRKYSHNQKAGATSTVSFLDDDPTVYYLCIYSNNSTDDTVRELTLASDFQISTLKELPCNKKLYLKRKKFHTKFV